MRRTLLFTPLPHLHMIGFGSHHRPCQCNAARSTAGIWETSVPSSVSSMEGLTTLEPHRRVTRAREPNADPAEGAETCTDCWHNGVTRWHHNEDCVGKAQVRNCALKYFITATFCIVYSRVSENMLVGRCNLRAIQESCTVGACWLTQGAGGCPLFSRRGSTREASPLLPLQSHRPPLHHCTTAPLHHCTTAPPPPYFVMIAQHTMTRCNANTAAVYMYICVHAHVCPSPGCLQGLAGL